MRGTHVDMATSALKKCFLCGSPSLTWRLYVSHLRVVHSKDPSFHLMCGIDGCREVFRTFSAFNSHVYRHHRDVMGVNSTDSGCKCSTDTTSPSIMDDCTEVLEGSVVGDQGESGTRDILSPDSELHPDPRTVAAAKFLLQLREGRQISQAAVSDIITGCKTLCKLSVDTVKDGVKRTLNNAVLHVDCVPGLAAVLDINADPFKGVDTNYLFESFCVNYLGCLVSTVLINTQLSICLHVRFRLCHVPVCMLASHIQSFLLVYFGWMDGCMIYMQTNKLRMFFCTGGHRGSLWSGILCQSVQWPKEKKGR